jgi:hypothetical protein
VKAALQKRRRRRRRLGLWNRPLSIKLRWNRRRIHQCAGHKGLKMTIAQSYKQNQMWLGRQVVALVWAWRQTCRQARTTAHKMGDKFVALV